MPRLRSGELLFGSALPQLLFADELGAPDAIGTEETAPDCGDWRERGREDYLPGPVDGHAHATREFAALDRPRADVDFAATNDHDGLGDRLVSGKDGGLPRTLALGALSIQLPATTSTVGAGDPRRFRRRAGD